MPSVSDIISVIEELAPASLAEGWDNTGLQVGDPGARVDRVLVALDPLAAVMDEARSIGAGMVITHHPLFFRELKRLDLSHGIGAVVNAAVRDGIAIYSAHTSLDRALPGISDALASAIGLLDPVPLEKAVGWPDGYGLGRVGRLEGSPAAADVARRLKGSLGLAGVNIIGDAGAVVSVAAVCGGSGAGYIGLAREAGADIYVTGDVKYHEALDAAKGGMVVLDIGHYGSELPGVELLAGLLGKSFMKKGWKVGVDTSRAQAEPWTRL